MDEKKWLEIFAERLSIAMYDAKYTQRDLAEMSGISESTISKYLNRQQIPGIKAIINMSYVLDCSVSDLVDFGEMID